MRPHADVKLFRLPPNLSSKSVAVVKVKPENKVVELETFHKKNANSLIYSSRLMQNHTPLAVAVIQDDSLFLTRVSEAYEFKPRFKLPDRSKSPAPTNETASSDEEKVSAVTMRFASANEDDKRKARESLYSYHQEKIDREDWIEMEFENEKSDRSKEVLKSLGRI
jgi:predicted metalloendopeptidase